MAFADPAQLLRSIHIERCEQRGGAMALIVVGHGGGAALLERQPGLGPVECLNLRLLIHAQHDGPVRRVEIQPDDLGDLSLEHRIIRDLEPLRDMRFETEL
jgi:hypothetical protein